MDTSLIISYRDSGDERRYNLQVVLDYLLDAFIGEIIVVEQDSETKMEWFREDETYNTVRHIFIKNPDVFNKGWGYNVGAKQAIGNYLIFHDADVLMPYGAYVEGVSLLSKYDVVDPYKNITYLNAEGSRYFDNCHSFTLASKQQKYVHFTVPSTVTSGGVFMISREKYFSLRGFDETCFGYGFEDNIFDTKIRRMGLNVKQLNHPCIHLHHKSIREGFDGSDEYYNFFKTNEDLYNKYLSLNKEQMTELIENTESWGEIHSDLVEQMEAFWDEKHKTENVPSLSGNTYEATVEYLKLEEYLKPGIAVLEVGVGLGYVTKRLHNLGMRVSAVDICEKGLERVKDYCENVYNAEKIESLPSDYFDVIICNAVVQHVDTMTMLYEFKHIMRSLKPKTGVFALQFVSSNQFEDNGVDDVSYADSISGRLCRTPEKMQTLLGMYDGKCTEVRRVELNISFLTGSHVFHVTK